MSKQTGSSEQIVFTSGKGGVGKTTCVANVGTALAKMGFKTVLVDMDIGLRNLDLLLGLENRIICDVVNVAKGKTPLRQALIRDKKLNDKLFLLPASQVEDKESLELKEIRNLFKKLKQEFDYVLIDSPAGIEQGFKNSIIDADKAVIVANPEISSVRDADRVIGLLESNVDEIFSMINKVDIELMNEGESLSVDDLNDILSVRNIGIIPNDKDIIISSNQGKPVARDTEEKIGRLYHNAARRLIGEDLEFESLKEKSWISKLLSF